MTAPPPHSPLHSPPSFKRAPRPAHAVSAAHPSASGATTVRLNKRMAELGLCSRREADAWIEKGWVLVNGQAAQMGMQVGSDAHITVQAQAQQEQEQLVTVLMHKPMGYVSGQAEDGHEPAMVLFQQRNQWMGDTSRMRFSPAQFKGLAPAGRLDIDSVGLLVFTQDGRVARQLIGEDAGMEKEYLVRVTCSGPQGDIDVNVQAHFPAAQMQRLRHGLSLDGKPLKPAQVEWQNPEQLRFVLIEGKKRQIRRMCEQVGLKVVGLKRIRMGLIALGALPVGQWRYLGANESF